MAIYKVRGSQAEGFFFGLYHDDGGHVLSGTRQAALADGLCAARALHAALRHADRFARQNASEGGWTFVVINPQGTILGRSKPFQTAETLEAGIRRAQGVGCGRSPAQFVDESDAARGFAPLPAPAIVHADSRLGARGRHMHAAASLAAPKEPPAEGTISTPGHGSNTAGLGSAVEESPRPARRVRELIGG